MLLFQKRFHVPIVDGVVTLTFRAWPKAKVKPGGRYRCHPIGVLEVTAIDRVSLDSISDQEAQRSGFESQSALIATLREYSPHLQGDSEVFRVAFRHGGDGDRVAGAMSGEVGDAEVAELAEKLRKLDERSPFGPWTGKTLALIVAHPRIAASQLAKRVHRETAPFKADVVKLKKLGLTQSFEVGYELTPRGETYLASKSKKKKKPPARKS